MNISKALLLLIIASMVLSLISSTHFAFTLPAPILNSTNEATGKIIEVTGPSGAVPANTIVQLYWETATGAWDGAKGLMNSTTADASGAYEVWFTVPEATFGVHNVWVKDVGGNTASAAFTMKTDNENSPETGLPGDTVISSFYGFRAMKDLVVMLSTDNVPVRTDVTEKLAIPNGIMTEFTGTLVNKYLEPNTFVIETNGVQKAHDDGRGNIIGPAGPLTAASARGTINYVTGSYDVIFTTPPQGSIELRADYRYWSTSPDVGSTQFYLGAGATNSVGTAVVSWKVPTNVAIPRTYTVFALDSSGVINSLEFRIMGIQLSSSSVQIGKTINLTGRGFSPNKNWRATISSRTVWTGTINADGSLQGGSGLNIPNGLAPGRYTITVLDIDSDFDSTAQFTVTYLTVTPSSAPNGFNVTILGQGFNYLITDPANLTFTLYNKTATGIAHHIWKMDVRAHTVTINGTGSVIAYWIVPDSVTIGAGTYYINSTYANDYLGQATLNVLVHDISVTRVGSQKTIVGQGYDTYVTVNLANIGTYPETFNVTLYAGSTPIGIKTVSLSVGSSIIVTFKWSTKGWIKESYTLKAVATTVTGETRLANNNYIDGSVQVSTPGDLNGDGKVDKNDMNMFMIDYVNLMTGGQNLIPNSGGQNWNPNSDINNDGKLDFSDLLIIIFHK